MNRFSVLANFMVVSIMLVGCSLPQRRVEKPRWLMEFEEVHGTTLHGEIIDLNRMSPIAFETLLDRLVEKRIIYVGERHDDMDHHDVQLTILEGLHARDPRLIIGMEMFEKSFQSVLDSWTDGVIDEEAFLRQSEWFSRWRFDFPLYEKILAFAREKKIRILALNASRELVAKVGDFGIDALSPGEKAMIAPLDTSDMSHRAFVQKVFETHPKSPGQRFENFYEAQCVRDDTMAGTIADSMTARGSENRRVIVFCGIGHMVYKFGVPMRAFRKTGVPYATILPSNLGQIHDEFDEDEEYSSRLLADFLWATEGSTLKTIRLGVVAEKSFAQEAGMVVRKVSRGSSADRAGIEAGDTILAIDETTINDLVDLRLALSRKAPGSTSRLVYLRDDERKETVVTFLKTGSDQ